MPQRQFPPPFASFIIDDMSASTARLRLRGNSGPVEAQIHFPATNDGARLVVAFVDEATAAALCSRLDAVVVAMSSIGRSTQALLEWIAAHAVELGASAETIAVTGIGDSAEDAKEVVAAAVRSGWPPLQLLDIATALDPRPRSGAARRKEPTMSDNSPPPAEPIPQGDHRLLDTDTA